MTFWRQQRGAAGVEYALLLGLLAVVITGALLLLGNNLSNTFSRASSGLNSAVTASDGGSRSDDGSKNDNGTGDMAGGTIGRGITPQPLPVEPAIMPVAPVAPVTPDSRTQRPVPRPPETLPVEPLATE